MSSTATSFFEYHEPSIEAILTLIAFFVALSIFTAFFERYGGVALLGQILVGAIFGTPLAGILADDWQSTFLALGYIGLIGLVFEGGLSSRLDLLFANLGVSSICALTGILAPIALSILFVHVIFGYTLIEGFIAGAALSATSLGTTFTVLKDAPIDLRNARVGAVLSSAAVIDDVVALVLAQVIDSLGQQGDESLGWVIGRPVLAAVGLALVSVPIAWALRRYGLPLLRRMRSSLLKLPRTTHGENLLWLKLLVCGWISIAAYAGTSILLGAYLAGVMVNFFDLAQLDLPPKRSTEVHEVGPSISHLDGPSFAETFEHKLGFAQVLGAWLFFASIGYCIPVKDLWQGQLVWQGIVYALIMVFGKLVVGVWLPILSLCVRQPVKQAVWPGLLLGSGMVARGEIGLLIIQIGFVASGKLSKDVFIISIWAILLNTILGPVAVRVLAKRRGDTIMDGSWGLMLATL